MPDKNIERILKCIRGDIKDDLISAIDESDLSEEKKESLKSQLGDIKSCRSKPIDIEDVESVSSLSEVLDGTVSILTQEKCPSCKILKERLKDSAHVEFVDFDSDEGQRMSEGLDLKTVPSAYTHKDGSPVKCEIFSDEGSVVVVCDGETIKLI